MVNKARGFFKYSRQEKVSDDTAVGFNVQRIAGAGVISSIKCDGRIPEHYRCAIVSSNTENRLRDRSRRSLKLIRICKSKYLNNRIEQDYRRIKRRVRSMLGFESIASARVILDGIEMIHMMRKRQARFAYNPHPSITEQFEILAA